MTCGGQDHGDIWLFGKATMLRQVFFFTERGPLSGQFPPKSTAAELQAQHARQAQGRLRQALKRASSSGKRDTPKARPKGGK